MKLVKNFLISIISIIFILSILEVILRVTGSKPRASIVKKINEPKIYVQDNDLGWVQKPGKYIFQPWSNEGKITIFTVNKNGDRSVVYESKSQKKIIFIGGSLTQGWAVDDKDNFVSIFQSINPEFKVINYGVGGYGGYQSLLMQEKVIKNENLISNIIYGFIDHHEIRNIAEGSWMYMLNEYSARGHTKLPYASINNENKLQKNPPLEYLKIPYSNYSSLLTKIEKRIMKIKSFNRKKNKFLISKKIIINMNENSKKIGSTFTLLFLDIDKKKLQLYKEFLDKMKIDYILCPFAEGHAIKGEGHPNTIAHKIVAECINENLNF